MARLVVYWHFAFLAVILAGFSTGSPPAQAASAELAREDKACLRCHGRKSYSKELVSGFERSLHVSADEYVRSVHGGIKCMDCHYGYDDNDHEIRDNQAIGTREYSIAALEACGRCHGKYVREFNDSLHARLAADDDSNTPICTDCHSPHTMQAGETTGEAGKTICQSCHRKVYRVHAKSVHGTDRAAEGSVALNMPGCVDCHETHAIKAAAGGVHIKEDCLNCHETAEATHADWLPNVGLHFESVSCAACHAEASSRIVNLRLFDKASNKALEEKLGVPQFDHRMRLFDPEGKGLDAFALQSLLKEISSEDPQVNMVLRGRLEVESGLEAHKLVGAESALKDCDLCHTKDSDIFQKVSISIVKPDGRPFHYGAQAEVLTSPVSVDSIRGFYAIGSTRIKLLDYLLVLVVAGTCAIPVGHITLRWIGKRYWQVPKD